MLKTCSRLNDMVKHHLNVHIVKSSAFDYCHSSFKWF